MFLSLETRARAISWPEVMKSKRIKIFIVTVGLILLVAIAVSQTVNRVGYRRGRGMECLAET